MNRTETSSNLVYRFSGMSHYVCFLAVSPSFSRYSHSSGEIEDYDAEDYQRGKIQHVYTYYKTLYKRAESMEMETEVT